MRAACYERTGPAAEVLTVEELPTPAAGPNEVRVRVHWSGVNPSDVKSRAGLRSKTLAFPRIVPHSDGAGVIDQAGEGVDPSRIGERVWVWNGAWGRAFGTAAEFIVLPSAQAVRLPDGVDPAAGACLGMDDVVQFAGGHAGHDVRDEQVEDLGGDPARGAHSGEALGSMQLDRAVASNDGIVAVEKVGIGHVPDIALKT